MDENTYEAVKEGVKESLEWDIAQQRVEQDYAWIYRAFYEGTKDAIREAIDKGKLKIN